MGNIELNMVSMDRNSNRNGMPDELPQMAKEYNKSRNGKISPVVSCNLRLIEEMKRGFKKLNTFSTSEGA